MQPSQPPAYYPPLPPSSPTSSRHSSSCLSYFGPRDPAHTPAPFDWSTAMEKAPRNIGHVLSLYKRQNVLDRILNFFLVIIKHVFRVFGMFFLRRYFLGYIFFLGANFWK